MILSMPNFNEKRADVDRHKLDIDDTTNFQRYLAKFDNLCFAIIHQFLTDKH